MPQFSPGQSKNAIVPATVTPSGLSCQLEVFLGPNESTKVATSGLKAFTSTGLQQSVAAPVVMPAAAGTYQVFIDLYAAGYYLAGYQATEDVIIASVPKILQVGALAISHVNNIPIVQTGIDPDGVPYGVLETPISVSTLKDGLTLKWVYSGTRYDRQVYDALMFFLRFEPGNVDFPCNSPPAFRAIISAPTYSAGVGTDLWDVPFGYNSPINGLFGGGYWCRQTYNAQFEWGITYGLSYSQLRKFRIKSIICTGTGGPVW